MRLLNFTAPGRFVPLLVPPTGAAAAQEPIGPFLWRGVDSLHCYLLPIADLMNHLLVLDFGWNPGSRPSRPFNYLLSNTAGNYFPRRDVNVSAPPASSLPSLGAAASRQ